MTELQPREVPTDDMCDRRLNIFLRCSEWGGLRSYNPFSGFKQLVYTGPLIRCVNETCNSH